MRTGACFAIAVVIGCGPNKYDVPDATTPSDCRAEEPKWWQVHEIVALAPVACTGDAYWDDCLTQISKRFGPKSDDSFCVQHRAKERLETAKWAFAQNCEGAQRWSECFPQTSAILEKSMHHPDPSP